MFDCLNHFLFNYENISTDNNLGEGSRNIRKLKRLFLSLISVSTRVALACVASIAVGLSVGGGFAFWLRKNWGERNADGSSGEKAKSASNVRKALPKRLLRRLGLHSNALH